jgi:hypothetical protein
MNHKKFETPEQMQAAIEEYFAKCDAGRKRKYVSQGRVLEIADSAIPYTVSGLALCLGVDIRTLNNYENRKGYEEFFPIVRAAKLRVLQCLEERGLTGEYNANIVKFQLSCNFGYKEAAKEDGTEIGSDSERNEILEKNLQIAKEQQAKSKEQ